MNTLESVLRSRMACQGSVVICGVGNEVRGDDAAGILVTRRLREAGLEEKGVAILECGEMPENFAGQLVRLCPDLIVFVDAADLGAPPGSLGLIEMDDVDGFCTSTHGLPLFFLARYLQWEIGADLFIIGIQPARLDLGAPLVAQVAAAVDGLALLLGQILGHC